jgi:hypothetical protein
MDSKKRLDARHSPSHPQSGRAEGGVIPSAPVTGKVVGASEVTRDTISHWFFLTICPSCGSHKLNKNCFCRTCYFALPKPLRNGLYVSMLDGGEFDDNYWKSVGHLRRIGLTK